MADLRARAWAVLVAGALGCGPVDTTLPCAPATPETIDGHIGDFYRCLDANTADGAGCGPDGYALGFGGHYAELFWDVTRPAGSPELAAWLERVGICLQEALADEVKTDFTCEAVRAVGFGTHAGCYVSTGFCALTLQDQLAVLNTVSPEDQDLPEVRASMREVLEACASQE